MSGRWCIMLISLTLLGMAGAWAQDELKDAAAKLATDIVQDVDAQKLKGQQLVIAEFQNINGRGDAVTKILQEKLTTAFIKAKHFRVVERAQLERAMRELKIDATGLTDPQYRKDLGKLVGAAYMVVGSLSEVRGTVSIDCRLVAIETGESVTAADVTIARVIDAGTAVPSPTNPANPPVSPVDVNTPANPAGTGTYLGKVENGGLLGGARFKVAWATRVNNPTPLLSFTAADVRGDGTSRLVSVHSLNGKWHQLTVWNWRGGRFQPVWKSEPIDVNPYGAYVRPLPAIGGISPIVISAHWGFRVYCWDGTRYADGGSGTSLVTDVFIDDGVVTGTGLDGTFAYSKQGPEKAADIAEWLRNDNNKRLYRIGRSRWASTIADLDGDGKLEAAVTREGGVSPVEIMDDAGIRKALIEGQYDPHNITRWKPEGAKTPYIVVASNTSETAGGQLKWTGGYIILIQWNGEFYEEVWKSDKLGDRVEDMQICDPKGEGKRALVVLSTDAKGSFLTRINAE